MWARNQPMDISGTNKQRMRGRPYIRTRFRRTDPGRQALKRVKRIENVMQAATNLKSTTRAVGGLGLASGVAQWTSIVNMQRGDTNILREGDKITLKSISWRISLALNTAEVNPTGVRFVIVYDRNPRGVQAAFNDVYNNTSINGLVNLDEDERGRFQIIHDQIWQLGTGGNEMALEKGFKDLKNKKVLYDANVGDITDVQQGNLFVAFITLGNASVVTANGYIRVRFVDDN